jgi:hypothetical protein
MFYELLPYAEALVGAGCVVLAIAVFLPMKRHFSAQPVPKGGSTSITTELTVIGWIALLLVGVMLVITSVM